MANTFPTNGSDGQDAEKTTRGTDHIQDSTQKNWDSVKDKAHEDLDDLKLEAQEELRHVRQEAGKYAEEQKRYAADQIDGLASAFGKVESELRDGEQAWMGRYAGDLAGRLHSFAGHARSRSAAELVGDLEQTGRERPTAFLAGAALLGFAATRFLAASSGRRNRSHNERDRGSSAGTAHGGNGFGERSDRDVPRSEAVPSDATARTGG